MQTAYAEILKQFANMPALIPDDYRMLKIHCDDSVSIEDVGVARLADEWRTDNLGPQICRPIGDEWLSSYRTELLKVPSAARVGSYNYLFNPNAFRADRVAVEAIQDLPR